MRRIVRLLDPNRRVGDLTIPRIAARILSNLLTQSGDKKTSSSSSSPSSDAWSVVQSIDPSAVHRALVILSTPSSRSQPRKSSLQGGQKIGRGADSSFSWEGSNLQRDSLPLKSTAGSRARWLRQEKVSARAELVRSPRRQAPFLGSGQRMRAHTSRR